MMLFDGTWNMVQDGTLYMVWVSPSVPSYINYLQVEHSDILVHGYGAHLQQTTAACPALSQVLHKVINTDITTRIPMSMKTHFFLACIII